jgi:hypothetical protein
MTLITFSDGKVVMRDGKVGTEQACCCDEFDCTGLVLEYDTGSYSVSGPAFASDCGNWGMSEDGVLVSPGLEIAVGGEDDGCEDPDCRGDVTFGCSLVCYQPEGEDRASLFITGGAVGNLYNCNGYEIGVCYWFGSAKLTPSFKPDGKLVGTYSATFVAVGGHFPVGGPAYVQDDAACGGDIVATMTFS